MYTLISLLEIFENLVMLIGASSSIDFHSTLGNFDSTDYLTVRV